jgi:nucleotidyltransferase/DNA polymerase involved in DNA repair
MLAKMACSVNKPNKQTSLLQSAVADFLAPMPVHKLPGVGHCMEGVLKQSGVESVGDLRNLTLDHLCRMFGERVAKFMYQACKGYDNTPVHDKGPCKSISVEDSFWNCTTLQQVEVAMIFELLILKHI